MSIILGNGDALKDLHIGNKIINKVVIGNKVVYNKSSEWPGLKFTSQQDCSTVGYMVRGTINKDIYISNDGKSWNEWDGSDITLNNGESICVWNKTNTLSSSESSRLNFVMSGSIAASGNCNSMIDFGELSNYCYYNMFYNCTALTQAPELPDTILAKQCYRSMFSGCTSLTTAPELPATTLANYCYYNMFQGCTALTQAPELPATTLANYCYYSMFYNCTALTQAPELPATTLANYCYYSMFQGCTALTQAPELPATQLADGCYYNMFSYCTSLFEAPELPATQLADGCYSFMFQGCTALTQAPELPATTLANYCYSSMFQGCTSLTTAPDLPATQLAESCYNYMFQESINLNSIKLSYTGNFDKNYFRNWVKYVPPSGILYYNGSDTSRGDSAIPSGWTVQQFTP